MDKSQKIHGQSLFVTYLESVRVNKGDWHPLAVLVGPLISSSQSESHSWLG